MIAARKITEDALGDARMLAANGLISPPAALADQLLDAMSEDDPNAALGRAAVLAATAIAQLENATTTIEGMAQHGNV